MGTKERHNDEMEALRTTLNKKIGKLKQEKVISHVAIVLSCLSFYFFLFCSEG